MVNTKESSSKILAVIGRQIVLSEMDAVISKFPKPCERFCKWGNASLLLDFILDIVEIGNALKLCPHTPDVLMNVDEETLNKFFEAFVEKVNERSTVKPAGEVPKAE